MTKLNKHILIPLVIASIAIAIFWIISLTLNSVIVFIPGVIVSYLLYLNTFYKKTPNPERILPLYSAKRKFYPDNVSPVSTLIIKLIVAKVIKAKY